MATLCADYNIKRLIYKLLFYVFTLFIINNILFARLNSYYLGGSITGAITLFFITFLTLTVKRRAVVPFVYAVYGLLAVPSHFYVGDYAYILHVSVIVVCAFVFDIIISGSKFNIKGIIAGYTLFVFLLRILNISLETLLHGHQVQIIIEAQGFAKSLILGYSGIALGWFVFLISTMIQPNLSIRKNRVINN